jgi:hypothetical protein
LKCVTDDPICVQNTGFESEVEETLLFDMEAYEKVTMRLRQVGCVPIEFKTCKISAQVLHLIGAVTFDAFIREL